MTLKLRFHPEGATNGVTTATLHAHTSLLHILTTQMISTALPLINSNTNMNTDSQIKIFTFLSIFHSVPAFTFMCLGIGGR